jgi:nicotinamidase-related amidase
MNDIQGTALLIIDLQKGILQGLGGKRQKEHDESLDAMARRVSGLLARARAAGIPVVFVQHSGDPGHRLEPKSEGWQLREEIAPMPEELIIHKRACDSFFETPLEFDLLRLRLRKLVIAGCMTQYCVDTTVRRAVSLGYDVVLAADGHTTADSGGLSFEQIIAHHNALLDGFEAGNHGVTVVPISQIETSLG